MLIASCFIGKICITIYNFTVRLYMVWNFIRNGDIWIITDTNRILAQKINIFIIKFTDDIICMPNIF